MRRDRLKWPLLAGLLCAAVLASAVRVFWFAHPARDTSGRTVLRLGHYMLAPATQEALAAVIADYERRRPDVRVIAMPIPERIYLTFLNAHLNADTAPDLLQIGHQFTGFEELRARFFCPITPLVEQPNPYNAGTASAGLRWRDTFIDGMNGLQAYSTPERQYYGVPMALATLRIFYNRALLREISGRDEPPGDYPGFIALCDQVEAFARKTGRSLSPVAGSRFDGLFLMSHVFSTVNQRLYFALDANHSLKLDWWDYPKAYLQGKWNYASPSIRAGYGLMREMGRHMRPGFLEMPPSEASFEFLQQQALMTIALTAESGVLRDNAPFPVGVACLPMVQSDDPRYGRFVLGPLSEANQESNMTFGVVQRSAHRELALDFLRYLGSHPASEIFSRHTGWVPVVANVASSAPAKPLQPVMNGYSGRFYAEMNGKGDGRFVVARNLYLLFARDGGVEPYCAYLEKHYGPAMITDLQKEVANSSQNLRRQEPVLLGTYARGAAAATETARIVAAQNYSETRLLQLRHLLGRQALK
jgi:ABC-type glycerol-3-phosphate transport system substrate-binding protein